MPRAMAAARAGNLSSARVATVSVPRECESPLMARLASGQRHRANCYLSPARSKVPREVSSFPMAQFKPLPLLSARQVRPGQLAQRALQERLELREQMEQMEQPARPDQLARPGRLVQLIQTKETGATATRPRVTKRSLALPAVATTTRLTVIKRCIATQAATAIRP